MKPTAPLRDNFSVFATTPCAWLISFSLDHAVNWEAISAIGQIVGAIGVVVSLIYVATEVRNSARATQLASRRSISEIFTLLSRQLAEHPDLRELYYRGLHDFESLEGSDLLLKAVTSNIRFICRRSVIPGSVFLCYETTACYSSYRRPRHWAIESETYMVSSYWSALLK